MTWKIWKSKYPLEEAELVPYRILLAVAALLYPVWYYIDLWARPDSIDSLLIRVGISLLCLGLLTLSCLNTHFKKNTPNYVKLIATVVTLHQFLLIDLNDGAPERILGLLIVVFAATLLFISPARLFLYSVLCVVLSLKLFNTVSIETGFFVTASVATTLIMANLSLQWRLSLLKSLREKDSALRSLLDTERAAKRDLEAAKERLALQFCLTSALSRSEVTQTGILDALLTMGLSFESVFVEHWEAVEDGSLLLKSRMDLSGRILNTNEETLTPVPAILSGSLPRIVHRQDVTIEGHALQPSYESIIIIPLLQEEKFCGLGLLFQRNLFPNPPDMFDTLSALTLQIGQFLSRQKARDQLLKQQQINMQTSKLSSLGEMAGGIAHEINNPLAIIQGRASQLRMMLEKGAHQPEEMLYIVTRIEGTCTRISTIVRGLRNFARDGSQDPMLSTPLHVLINETLSFCEERFRQHGVTLIRGDIPDNESVPCRFVEISQLLLNLLNNAYDAVESQEEKWVKIHCEADSQFVKIFVSDSGLGISDDVQKRLFDPFFTTKEVNKGTGLGLPISKGIAEGHGGSLILDGKSAQTTFVLTLPKNQKKKTEPESRP